MNPSRWRPLLLAFCVGCAALNAYTLFTDATLASSGLGFAVARVSDPALVRVDSIDPQGPAAAIGLRLGDLIHLRELSPGVR